MIDFEWFTEQVLVRLKQANTSHWYNQSQKVAARDSDGGVGGSARGADLLDGIDNIESINDLAKDDMFAVQMRGVLESDEELRSVGVWSRVGHGKKIRLAMVKTEALILEFLSVDALATSAVSLLVVATLEHESWDDSVDGGAPVIHVSA